MLCFFGDSQQYHCLMHFNQTMLMQCVCVCVFVFSALSGSQAAGKISSNVSLFKYFGFSLQ